MADPYQDHPDVSPGVDSIWSSVGGATMWVPGSANGGSITAVYNVVGQYGADNTGVVDATTAIQNALDAANTAGGGVVYVPRGSYLFTQLKMYSNVCLWLDGTLTQKAGTNTATIVNAAYVAGTGRDSNISIIGRGKIDRGANAGTGLNRNIVMFQRVDGVVIKGLGGLLNFASTGGKFAVNLYACTNFEVGGLQLSVAADGVHITGLSTGGWIHDIYGTTGDDSVALTPVDWAANQNGDYGDISDVKIERVFTTSSTNLVTMVGGTQSSTHYACRRIIAQHVHGSAPTSAVWIGGNTGDAATQGGSLYDITIDDVTNTNASASGCVRVANVGSPGVINNLVVSRIPFLDVSNQTTVSVESTASSATSVTNLLVRDCYWVGTTNGTAPIIVTDGGAGCSVNELTVENCTLATSNTYMVQMQGTSPVVGTAKAGAGVRLALSATNGGFIRAAGSGSPSLTNLMLAQIDASRCSWVAGDIGGTGSYTVNLFVDGVSATTVLGLLNIRSGSTVTIAKAHGITGAHATHIANAGTLNGLIQTSGTGAPTKAAQVGDLYDRADGGSGTYRYRCTVAGDDGAATWAGIL